MRFFALLLTLISASAWAQSSTSFECSVSSEKRVAKISVSAVGEAAMSVTEGKTIYKCPLELSRFEDRRRAVISEFRLFLSRQPCTPALTAELESDLRQRSRIMIYPHEGKPKAKAFVFATEDIQDCSSAKISLSDLEVNGKKWKTKDGDTSDVE